jgi:hypothetical protein
MAVIFMSPLPCLDAGDPVAKAGNVQVSREMLGHVRGQGQADGATGGRLARARSRAALGLLLAGVLLATVPAHALPYEVHVAGSGDDGLDRAI